MQLNRRSLLKLGGLSILGLDVDPILGRAKAQGRVTPRGNAKAVIFLNLQGGPSQMDMFDVKFGK